MKGQKPLTSLDMPDNALSPLYRCQLNTNPALITAGMTHLPHTNWAVAADPVGRTDKDHML